MLQSLLSDANSKLEAGEVEADEHLRYQAYKEAVDAKSNIDDVQGLIETLSHDPDRTMASAAATYLVDAAANTIRNLEEFSSWTQKLQLLQEGFEFPQRRAEEWILYKKIQIEQADALDEIQQRSDWVQRKVAAESNSTNALELLAESGRTKRIRSMAQQRLRTLRNNK